MLAISRKHKIPYLQSVIEILIDKVKTYGVIKPLQFLYPSEPYDRKLAYMRSLPPKTIGYDLAKMLDEKGLKLIPNFENHDLNHLVLNYGMDTESELCMQAYLLGNGNMKGYCILFLSSGLLLPNLWKTLYIHFKKGQRNPSISTLSFENCLEEETHLIRKQYRPN